MRGMRGEKGCGILSRLRDLASNARVKGMRATEAAKLAARLAGSTDGARQMLACEGSAALIALWEKAPEAIDAASAAAPPAASALEHQRLASMYACHAIAQLVIHALQVVVDARHLRFDPHCPHVTS